MRTAQSLTALICLLLASPTFAVDGVHEINHACATSADGCFPGDAGGYPVTISSTGSYRLTSDLRLTNPSQSGVVVEASFVDIDLNHFSIQGAWFNGACGAVPSGMGVYASTSTIGVGVRNGIVSGMGVHGLALQGTGSRVEGVFSLLNCTTGILLGHSAHVSDTQAWRNGAHGIAVHDGSIVTRSIATDNDAFGILGNGPGVLITDSTASSNLDTGIHAVTGGLVARSTARGNGSPTNLKHGIAAPMILESVSTLNTGRAMSGLVLGLSLGDGNMSGENVACIAVDIAGTPSIQCPAFP